ncbi:hypothetical protein [Mycobacterium servetii]|uniref:Uncharacterized protein n=1 Tax=Mycobacterium servetii TaxID=3237418 RepID=A0ABV4BXA7_9MYCO
MAAIVLVYLGFPVDKCFHQRVGSQQRIGAGGGAVVDARHHGADMRGVGIGR